MSNEEKIRKCKYCGYKFIDEDQLKSCEHECKRIINNYKKKYKVSFDEANRMFLEEFSPFNRTIQ